MLKDKQLKDVVKQLKGASKMHAQQAKKVQNHIDAMKKPRQERDPFPKREQQRMIKLTPEQRKKERNEKAHFGIHVANVAVLRGLGRATSGVKAASRARNNTLLCM
jgi:polyhydroxyalkanoate synthesis regulator phasin